MSERKAPGWLRILGIIFGLIAIVLSIVVLAYPELAILTLIFILSTALLIIGIARVVIGGFSKVFPSWLRGLLLGVGLLTIILSFVVFISPAFGFLTLVFILSIVFLLNGIARIVSGITGVRLVAPASLEQRLIL